MVCIIIAWKDILKLLTRLDELYGSWIWGLILCLGSIIAVFNMFVGFMLTLEKIIEKKLKPHWFYIYIILTGLGIFALQELIQRIN